MGSVEVVNTTYLHDTRPYVVRAQGETNDGRHVEGIGVSNLTRNRATNKAISNAESLGDRTNVSFQVMEVNYQRTAVSVLESDMQQRERDFPIPPYKVRVSASADGRSADGAKSSWLTFGGTLESAVKKAESQLQRMG